MTLSAEHAEIVHLLLQYGANPLETNSEGKTAIDLLLNKDEYAFPSLFNDELSYVV